MMTLLIKENQLYDLIAMQQAKVGVIGLGYVGLPLAMTYVKKGYNVIGFDMNNEKLQLLSEGKSYINDVSNKTIKEARSNGTIDFTSNMALISDCDVIVICVPTPLNQEKDEPDMSYIRGVVIQLIEYCRPNQLLILESTTYPGTTRNEIAHIISSKTELNIGTNLFIAYSPERIDPGNKDFKIQDIPKVVGGLTDECLKLSELFYSKVVNKVHSVSTLEIAETAKLLENTYRFVNLAFVNEMAEHCRKLNIDIWEVINASGTKPFGFQKFFPGPGVGGHCIPIDPFYFKWVANKANLKTKLIDLSTEINNRIPDLIVEKTKESIGKSFGNILIVGVAYKRNINDFRESPALTIINKLIRSGFNVDYYDPNIPNIRIVETDVYLSSINNNEYYSNNYNVVIIHTDHDEINYEVLKDTKATIIDTRNILRRKNIRTSKLINL